MENDQTRLSQTQISRFSQAADRARQRFSSRRVPVRFGHHGDMCDDGMGFTLL